MRDHEAIREALEREIDERLTTREWEAVVRVAEQYGGDVEDALVADLVAYVDTVRAALGEPERRPKKPAVKTVDRLGAMTRAEVVSLLVADEASRDEQVVRFRRSVLDDDVMLWVKVVDWIEVGANLDAGENEGRNRSGLLAYAGPESGFVRRVAVFRGTDLDRLRKVSEHLASTYGWQDAQATVFVLTGAAPFVPSVRGSVRRSSALTANRIVLDIDPWTDPRDVADAYKAVRSAHATKKRFQPLDARTYALVAFLLDYDREASDAARKKWNATYGKREGWSYARLEAFQQAARKAFANVTDPRIQ